MSQTHTIMVFFNLKPGVNEADYLTWAKTVDLPTVNGLNSVASFDVFQGVSLMGQSTPSPWQYFEVINIVSEEAFLADIQTDVMQKVVAQFQAFTEEAHFILTKNITA